MFIFFRIILKKNISTIVLLYQTKPSNNMDVNLKYRSQKISSKSKRISKFLQTPRPTHILKNLHLFLDKIFILKDLDNLQLF